MQKILLEVENSKDLENDDIFVYRDGVLVNISKAEYLHEIPAMRKELDEYKKDTDEKLENIKKGVNEKLESYHKILQVLINAKEED